MRKAYRVSSYFVYDVLYLPGTSYKHVDSSENCLDLLTKPLPKDTHFKHVQFMGLNVLSGDNQVMAMVAHKAKKGFR